MQVLICIQKGELLLNLCIYIIIEGPRISLLNPAGELSFREGGILQINVSVTGIPQPSITWIKYGEEIDVQDPRVMITNSSLRLSNVVRGDAGIYTISATNIVNTAQVTYSVIIQCKNRFIVFLVSAFV